MEASMPEQRKKDALAPTDKRVRHGLKSWVNSKRVLYGRSFQKVRAELGLYIRKYGVIDSRAAKRRRLELSPILSKNWVSYGNVVRQGILALKEIEKGMRQKTGPDFLTIAAELDAEKAARTDTLKVEVVNLRRAGPKGQEAPAEATPGPGSHQDASIEGDEPNPLDKEDTPPGQERRVWLRGAAGRGFQELCARCDRPCKVLCSVGNLASSFICNDFMVQNKKEGCHDADAV
jgi:hypothetical protein